MRVAFLAEGDANTADCWSGSGRAFVNALREGGVHVDTYDAELKSIGRLASAAIAYHPVRARWQQRYALGAVSFGVRSRQMDHALLSSRTRYDAVIQVGATFIASDAARRGAPYVMYCDSNLAYALRGAPYSGASRLPPREVQGALRRERTVYDFTDRIWTMSDALAHSFRDDFGQPRAKMKTIYAGANNAPSTSGARGDTRRILFVGKDHRRKGSEMLLEAFARVRAAVPNAELHLVGGVPPNADQPGVVAHGVVSRANPEGRRLLDELFGTAMVFCLPSRYEPFGIAFVEAMLAGLPCVGTAAWAMPEIIEDGKTGWLVPDGSVDELARVLVGALRDPVACARMGALGRERSLTHFTWPRVADRAIADLHDLIGATARRSQTRFEVIDAYL